MEKYFLISQVLMTVSIVVTFVAFQIKRDKYFRLMFVISGLFAGIHFILLGAYTAASMVFISGSRWLVSIFSKHRYWFWLYIVAFCLSLYCTYDSLVSLIPFAAVILGTIAVFNPNQLDARKMLLGVDSLWVINNLLIFTPVGILAHILFFLSGWVGYRRLK